MGPDGAPNFLGCPQEQVHRGKVWCKFQGCLAGVFLLAMTLSSEVIAQMKWVTVYNYPAPHVRRRNNNHNDPEH